MQTLAQSLQDHDRGHLKVIADLWGLELPNDPRSQVATRLSDAMLDRTPEILETLPGNARLALDRILESGGRAPMEALVRQFGPWREMGPGKRDRTEPWKEPESPLEMLWYRGLIAKAFADSTSGPQEFGFIPDDLLEKLPGVGIPDPPALGEPASPPKRFLQTSVLDDATTILAAYRRAGGFDHAWLLEFIHQPDSLGLVEGLLQEAEIIDSAERVRDFLHLPPKQAFERLQKIWKGSTTWNDLSHTPGILNPTDDWPNDPVAGRQAALSLIQTVPSDTWWSVSSLIEAVHGAYPGFMRPPGGFESWYLQSSRDDSSLRGFEAWRDVEGKYLEHLIVGPMLWLGLTEVSLDRSAFQLAAHKERDHKEGRAVAYPDGRIRVARGANRALRYQLARLCSWERMDKGAYHYRLTAQSLRSAEERGLTAAHAGKALKEIDAPKGVLKALKRWERSGLEAQVEHQMVLYVDDPKVLDLLLGERRTSRYLGERLGPISVVVDSTHWPKLQEAALRLGLLIDIPDQ